MKYQLVKSDSIRWRSHILYRIQRLSDGKTGGFIESEDNLSQEGDCWVEAYAKIYENARVTGNAIVKDRAEVQGNSIICDDAIVGGTTHVTENAFIGGNASVMGTTTVTDNVAVMDSAMVENSTLKDFACIFNEAIIIHSRVVNYGKVYGSVKLIDCTIKDNAEVYGKGSFSYCKIEKYGQVHSPKKIALSKCTITDYAEITSNYTELKHIYDPSSKNEYYHILNQGEYSSTVLNNNTLKDYQYTIYNLLINSNHFWFNMSGNYCTRIQHSQIMAMSRFIEKECSDYYEITSDKVSVKMYDHKRPKRLNCYKIISKEIGEVIAEINPDVPDEITDSMTTIAAMVNKCSYLYNVIIHFDINGIDFYHKQLSGKCIGSAIECLYEIIRTVNIYLPVNHEEQDKILANIKENETLVLAEPNDLYEVKDAIKRDEFKDDSLDKKLKELF